MTITINKMFLQVLIKGANVLSNIGIPVIYIS